MTKIPVDQLKPCRRLPCRVYDPDGGLLFERGNALLPTHLAMLKQCSIQDVVMADSADATGPAIETLQCQPLRIDRLQAGSVLSGDLFDEEGYRLVPAGVTITPDVLRRLQRLGVKTARLLKPRDHRAQSQLLRFRSMASPRLAPRRDLDLEIGRSAQELKPATRVDLMINRFEPKLRRLPMQVTPRGARAIDFFSRAHETRLRPLSDKRRVLDTFMQLDTQVRHFMKIVKTNPAQDVARLVRLVRAVLKALTDDPQLMLTVVARKSGAVDYLPRHSFCVAVYAMAVAAQMGYGVGQVVEIGLGGLLHDIGMLKVPEQILDKPGKLRPDEIVDIRKHPGLGLDLMKRFKNVPESVPYTTWHSHERCDASGYPSGRAAEDIHTYARIVAVADVYDAMLTDRPFRQALAPHLAMVELLKQGRQGKLASPAVSALVEAVGLYPVGSIVGLSDGSVARVICSGGRQHRQPVVNVLVDPDGARTDGRRIVDLRYAPELAIVREMTGETRRMDVFVGF